MSSSSPLLKGISKGEMSEKPTGSDTIAKNTLIGGSARHRRSLAALCRTTQKNLEILTSLEWTAISGIPVGS